MREDEGFALDFEFLMKKFIYLFVLDIGVSPFVQCYEGCNLIQGCIEAYRIDFLKELLMHQYECLNRQELDLFLSSAQVSQDKTGNNLMHSIFAHTNEQMKKLLTIVMDPRYKIKGYLNPNVKQGFFSKNKHS